ncbi:hypothetical protein BU24DRAFT_204379 [Aaosphaeria arxii CBS 175.79]|uniref:Uncharacterized protein n=1 Tax=Aaosphaeria arxii CBS 175.79 TaxID=1450172 RepID=A0A6A5XV16_9PLEO|nr:uncharacterized protein BU24DRAFT_204379 [Aaosphaeria arxii CBS 175.79]KAF2016551.1 hypothetical protein BU24DRAFT_204379 [Aaosphaeria arxii CBS 175.79]
MKAELLQRVREQIERVVKAPAESQSKILDAEAMEIATTVMESQAALDNAKKVSVSQIQTPERVPPRTQLFVHTGAERPASGPSSSESSAMSSPLSPDHSPVITPASPTSPTTEDTGESSHMPLFEHSASSIAGTRSSTWARMSDVFGKWNIAPSAHRPTTLGAPSSRVAS